ncbi:glycosyltransferase family 92 protein RCOM_0530710-like [Mangifera indica]|uniref:glycosyltransferase family 92 protein RCOM_0530710-like n=1 Tax=Mangifera indica TaxID=29780 RepID=UPI001CF9E61B|nr:glycosyltransferase family 92 protein RCOM_0530710-like [Mangifera indica]
MEAMKFRRKGDVVSWSNFFRCTIFIVVSCFTFSAVRLFFAVLGSTSQNSNMEVIKDVTPVFPAVSIRETVMLPDQVLIFLKYPPSAPFFTKEDFRCVYSSTNSSSPNLIKQPPIQIDGQDFENQIVRCSIPPSGFMLSLDLKAHGIIPIVHIQWWNALAYEALIDRDNSTVVFVKGLNLRPERMANASKFECVYGWNFNSTKYLLRTEMLSIAQEIGRCKTPLSVLKGSQRGNRSVKVSIRIKGKGIYRTIARPIRLLNSYPPAQKQYEMCICTMLRNQAKFIKEWIMYHAEIGVQRWFIYDNNSEDEIESIIKSLSDLNYNITRHVWPWTKTQEAGFAHCALRAREVCDWVGFIDVDEFFHLPSGLMLYDVVGKYSGGDSKIGELRVSCHSFGPSGLKHVPTDGVTLGYTCRMVASERHKSIVKPEALSPSLINVVHHFHLRAGFYYLNVDKGKLIINHYKYQVWEVFKEKFYRRVAAYVVDWQDTQSVGSKDRAPGLGTRAVEPEDWTRRFCEVNDSGLREKVLRSFVNPQTKLLPWQEELTEVGRRKKSHVII